MFYITTYSELPFLQTTVTKDHLNLFFEIISSLKITARKSTKQTQQKDIEVITATEDNIYIKEFIELETNSDSSAISYESKSHS